MTNQKILKEFENYLLANNGSKETIKSYTRTIKQFLGFLKKNPNNITDKDLNRYKLYAVKIKQYDANTLTPKYCAINSFMKFLDKPYRLTPPPLKTKNKAPFTRNEIKQLFEASKTNPRDHALLKTFYYSMLRRSEIQHLNIEDIDFQRQKIRVNKAKGNKYDEINIYPDALKAISDYLDIRASPKEGHEHALFLNRDGERIGKTDVSLTIKRYANEIGLSKRAYPHLFRISAITHMAESGVNMEEIRRQSRHKDYETLQGYMQLSDKHVRDEYLRGIALDAPEKPKQELSQQTQLEQRSYSNNIEEQLIQKLINGEITSEAFLEARRLIQISQEDVRRSCHQEKHDLLSGQNPNF